MKLLNQIKGTYAICGVGKAVIVGAITLGNRETEKKRQVWKHFQGREGSADCSLVGKIPYQTVQQ